MPRMLLAAALVLALAGCTPSEDAAKGPATVRVLPGAPDGKPVARVEGELVTEPVLEVFARGRGLDPDDPAQRERALDALVETMLLARDAEAAGTAERPEVRAELALVHLQQLSGRRLAALREEISIDEQAVEAYYLAELERAGARELKLQHMLFADEATAREAAARAAEPGADFEELMAEYAARGARQARELGWVNGTQLPEGLYAAASKLADGESTPQPVASSYGWHVLRRLESRPFEAPTLESVRASAQEQLRTRALAERVAGLREGADVELLDAAADGG